MKKLLTLCLTLIMVLTTTVVFNGCDVYIPEEAVKIGIIYVNDIDQDAGYTAAHEQGVKDLIANLRLKDSQIIRVDNIDYNQKDAVNSAIDSLIEQDCKLIIGTNKNYNDAMVEKATQYPEIMFSNENTAKATSNMINYFGKIYQARYLSGIVAGLNTKSNKIGYVSAFDTTVAECSSAVNAFALGVQAVNPTAKILVKAVQNWCDPYLEKHSAEWLIGLGCDVITQDGDTNESVNSAITSGVYTIGYNTDMSKFVDEELSSNVLTSVVWNWGVYYTELVENFLADNFAEVGDYYKGYQSGLYGLANLSSSVSGETAEILTLVEGLLNDESWDVFNGEVLSFEGDTGSMAVVKTEKTLLKHAQNSTELEEVGTITNSDILSNMPYYLQGVTLIA